MQTSCPSLVLCRSEWAATVDSVPEAVVEGANAEAANVSLTRIPTPLIMCDLPADPFSGCPDTALCTTNVICVHASHGTVDSSEIKELALKLRSFRLVGRHESADSILGCFTEPI